MPPRARPGNRRAVERALGEEYRLLLDGLCTLFDVSRTGWQRTPLQEPFETAGVLLRADKLVEDGMPRTRAEEEAAAELDIPVETINSRLRRWVRSSRRCS